MKTVTIQIGNSDDKLTQLEWSRFCKEVDLVVSDLAETVHFHATSPGDAPWQNACWVACADDVCLRHMKNEVSDIRERHRQVSVAWTEGETEFV